MHYRLRIKSETEANRRQLHTLSNVGTPFSVKRFVGHAGSSPNHYNRKYGDQGLAHGSGAVELNCDGNINANKEPRIVARRPWPLRPTCLSRWRRERETEPHPIPTCHIIRSSFGVLSTTDRLSTTVRLLDTLTQVHTTWRNPCRTLAAASSATDLALARALCEQRPPRRLAPTTLPAEK